MIDSTSEDNTQEALVFRPSARLQRLLGRELISDPNLAVLEFVKNGYDAGAESVLVQFNLTGERSSLVIADDGEGMDLASFRENWMRPGYSRRSPEAPSGVARQPTTAAGRRSAARVPVGEKGLGRLAAGRLGGSMEVFTRPSADVPWLHVTFEWSDFDDMTKAIDDIQIPYEHEDTLPLDIPFEAGTVAVITDLSRNWKALLPGRRALGRSRSRLGRLKEDLQLLVRPLGAEEPEFRIELTSDYINAESDVGEITHESAVLTASYRYEFSFALNSEGRVVVSRTLHRSESIVAEFASKKTMRFPETVVTADVAKDEEQPQGLECGPFSGVFLYNPPPSRSRASQGEMIGHGVLLYRDGILVEPYGIGTNDWLGVEARKASRQGYALQPATLWGEVLIERDINPSLCDTVNRQGLIENEASQQFFDLARAEFRRFEVLVTEEIAGRWITPEQVAKERAGDRLEAVRLRSKAFTHAIRQPVFGIAGELTTLSRIVETAPMPDTTRDKLGGSVERMGAFVTRVEGEVARFSRSPTPDFERVDIAVLLENVVDSEREFAKDYGVELQIGPLAREELVLPGELVHDVVAELIRNAAELNYPDGRVPMVRVEARMTDREVVVSVQDSGPGMEGVVSGTALREIELDGTKGRPSEGLSHVASVMAFFGGNAVVAENRAEGVTIELHLPRRLADL